MGFREGGRAAAGGARRPARGWETPEDRVGFTPGPGPSAAARIRGTAPGPWLRLMNFCTLRCYNPFFALSSAARIFSWELRTFPGRATMPGVPSRVGEARRPGDQPMRTHSRRPGAFTPLALALGVLACLPALRSPAA